MSTATAARGLSTRAQLFTATWLSYAGFYATRKVFNVVKGPIKHALDLDDAGVANLWTVYLVAYAAGQFFSAWLSRRMSNKKQLLLGMGTSVLCNIAMGALLPVGSSVTPVLAVILAIQGIAQATGWPCNVGLMAKWTHRQERGRIMAIWATCYQLGAVGAKALAAFFFGWLGLSWSFWGAAAVLAVITVIFAVFAQDEPNPPIPDESTPASPSANEDKPAVVTSANNTARQTALVVAMGAIYFAFKFTRYALDDWSALILAEHFHFATDVAGYLSTAFDWVGFIGVLVAGWASDRLFKSSRLNVIAIMTVGCLLVTSLMYGIGLSSPWAFVIMLGVVGFMVMGPDSLLSGAGAMDTGSREQATRAAGIINGCGAIGPILQERLIGQLKQSYGDDVVFLVIVLMMVLATIAVGIFWLTLRRLKIKL